MKSISKFFFSRTVFAMTFILFFLTCILGCTLETKKDHKTEPLRVIFDTDIGGDNDDASATAILHALADSGKVDILAMGVVSAYPYAAACLDAINTYYGRGTIPIGVIKTKPASFYQSQSTSVTNYSQPVAEKCPYDIEPESQIPDVVQVYRKILASQPNGKVTMIAVGMMDNLVNLINSNPDEYSKLTGYELVKCKVSVLFVMAPYFNEQNEYQRAYNFTTSPGSAVELVKKWPTKIKFGEGNLGHEHFIGSWLRKTPAENPVRVAFEAWSKLRLDSTAVARDRHCADPTTVIYAVYGLKYFNEVGPGACDIRQEDGSTRWDSITNRQNYYNTQKLPIDELELIMNRLLIQPPKRTN
ncbi:MAG TPA: hypothetical protein VMV77_08125 [Bacteroidales bacterium]|nr:hypothetical protein [Bacteroidales bacterium]